MIEEQPVEAVDFDAVARRLAGEVAGEPGWRGWRRVNTLLDLFGLYRLTPASRTRIAAALAGAGLEADPSIERAKRHETVRLTLAGERKVSTVAGLSATKVIRFFDAVPGERPREVELAEAGHADGVLVVDLDVLTVEADDAEKALVRLCGPSMTRAIVDDLLSADARPKTVRFDDERVRLVATIHVAAEEHDGSDGALRASKAGRLVFRPVELAVGQGWVVVARHKGGVYEAASEVGQCDPLAL